MPSDTPADLFYSYSSHDEKFRLDLERHLAVVRRDGILTSWSCREIAPGSRWDREIRQRLDHASIILMLVSAAFLESEYIWSVEVKSALERHRQGAATVVPVILKPCDWQATPLGDLQALPTNAKPIVAFRPRDKGWLDVVRGIRQLSNSATSVFLVSPHGGSSGSGAFARQSNPNLRILVIDDDIEMRDLYRTFLSRTRGCYVQLAVDGREGILCMEQENFHVVILDLMMPNMSGEEWLAWYKSQARQDAHVIIISASRNILTVARGLRNVSAISKPFDLHELNELVGLIWAERSQSLLQPHAFHQS